MRLSQTPALMIAVLRISTAGCGPRRPFSQWIPGVYQYKSSLAGTGEVAGTIEIGLDGPLGVTSTVGPCDERIETTPRQLRERIDGQLTYRNFICGTDYRFSVSLRDEGEEPPIQGSISNERTEIVRYYAGQRICLASVVTDEGEHICTEWSKYGWQSERRTTGATARWHVVVDSLASGR
jgi:hypothetical protein